VVCEGCGTDLGYRPPAMMDRLLCRDCARQRDKMVRRSRSEEKRGEEHVCGLLACSNRFHAKPARVARSKTGKVYCCHAHARADCSTRTTVRCIACGNTRFYKAAHIPLSVDRDTMSWTCPGCRQPKSAMRVLPVSSAPSHIDAGFTLGHVKRNSTSVALGAVGSTIAICGDALTPAASVATLLSDVAMEMCIAVGTAIPRIRQGGL
jgi:hypothetical protein